MEQGFVSGHDFSRAASAAKRAWPLGPEGRLLRPLEPVVRALRDKDRHAHQQQERDKQNGNNQKKTGPLRLWLLSLHLI